MEFTNHQAIYLQIENLFCEHILLKKWKPGDRIPSVREMAVSVEVNSNTVLRTYSYLQERSILINRRGIGYFVAEEGFVKARELRKADFISHELPQLFNNMDLLRLSLKEIKIYQLKWKENYRINQNPIK